MDEPECKRKKIETNDSENVDSPGHLKRCAELLSEADVGIEAFMSNDTEKFRCTLKNRWEDFIVREVLDGNVARLTNLNAIPEVASNLDEETSKSRLLLQSYLDELDSLQSTNGEKVVRIKASDLKEDRKAIHFAIRNIYPSLCSTTLEENGTQFIIVSKSESSAGVPKRAANRMPPGLPYCRFVLYKEGKDTLSAISTISRHLHLNPGCFTYAGTKDRRAITTQFVTVKKIDSKRLSSLNRCLHGIRLGDFQNVSQPLFLGDLDGNQFVVVLRSVDASDKIVQDAVNSLKLRGFVNYYGLQRFGHSVKSKSFEIGKHLIRGEWSKAIDLILTPTDADLPGIRETKQRFYETGDAVSCASNLPPSIEKYLMQGVAKHGKTLNAIQMLPRNLRQLYVHSYQSLVWNRIATRRVLKLGVEDFHAKPGDLYISDASKQVSDVIDVCEPDGEPVTNSSTRQPNVPTPKVATLENCHKIPLTDVVLPLPGFDVNFPENEAKQWYSEVLNEDGLKMEDMRNRVKDFNLPGSYRPVVVVPTDVTYRIVGYTDPDIPLVKSDLKILNEKQKENHNGLTELVDEEPSLEQPYRAVILQFTLPKSSYATMAVRELTKCVYERH